MVVESKDVTIDGMRFQVHSMPALRAARLDKILMEAFTPLLGAIEDFDLSSDIDTARLATAIQTVLTSMDEAAFESFITQMLSRVVYVPDGSQPVELDRNQIDVVFRQKLVTMYKLVYEVAKYEGFTPFVLLSDKAGGALRAIAGLSDRKKSGQKTGGRSAK